MSDTSATTSADASSDGAPLLTLVVDEGNSSSSSSSSSSCSSHSPSSPLDVDPAPALTPAPAPRLAAAWLVSLLATAVLCTAIARAPPPAVFHVAPVARLLMTERDQLYLQPNTALWPNVCHADDDANARNQTTADYRYELAAAMIIKNESAWIYEALEYHIEMGVQHFFIVDDNSDDDTREALVQYVEDGLVTLLTMPELMAMPVHHAIRPGPDSYTPRQNAALYTAMEWGRAAATRAKWMLVMDTDERYVVHGANPCIRSFLSTFSPDTGVVYWHWQMFGTSGVERLADDEPMIGALTRKASFHQGDTGHFKPAVRPDAVHYFRNTHKPVLSQEPIHSTLQGGSGQWVHRFTDGHQARGSFDEPVTIHYAQMNHYFTRDRDYHRRFKIPERQAIAHDTAEWHDAILQVFNQTEDLSAVPFAPAVMRRMHQRRTRYTPRRS